MPELSDLFISQEGEPPPFYDLSAHPQDVPTDKKDRKGNTIIKEGYIGKPKGMKQIAWERGLHKPENEGKMHGDTIPEDDERDRSLSLKHVLSNCWDFAHEKTALQELVESRGHILRMCVKGHPELAGVGIEYSWGKAKQKFRRETNDRIAAHLHANIVACFSRLENFLPPSRVRKFARRSRAYRRAYKEGKPNSHADVEKLVKCYKSHRSADVFDKKFCHED